MGLNPDAGCGHGGGWAAPSSVFKVETTGPPDEGELQGS